MSKKEVATHASSTELIPSATPIEGSATLTDDPMNGNMNAAAQVTINTARLSVAGKAVEVTDGHYSPPCSFTRSGSACVKPVQPFPDRPLGVCVGNAYNLLCTGEATRPGQARQILLSAPGSIHGDEEGVKVKHTDGQSATGGGSARNRLQFETSPYLLQHADNPVDWFPWSEEAFRKAVAEDKPIFLSIGYSSCHWCHVMADESFRDLAVAAILNASFVAIKVDREERPDIDQVYMTMAQAVTGQGGWPLTAVMTSDGTPFFLGTYMPRESTSGQVGLVQLLTYVAAHWTDDAQRSEIIRSGRGIVDATRAMVAPRQSGDAFPVRAAERAYAELAASFDAAHGGFGDAPKFPTPGRLRFLLWHSRDTGSRKALEMVTRTLDAMRFGGIYDHLDSGFHRYSVDREWAVPHFEKMLYDQVLLAEAYLDAYMVTGTPLYCDTVREVLGYVLRRLTSPSGGFYCAQDADSAAGEGAYYLWTVNQLRSLLDEPDLRVVFASMGILPEDGEQHQIQLHEDRPFVVALANPTPLVAEALGLTLNEVETSLQRVRRILLAARQLREPVMVDDKILTDWNGLAISALSRAGRVLGRPELIEAAERSADFVLNAMVDVNGSLMHAFKNGVSTVAAFLDDYASMVVGLLELYQATHRVRHMRSAMRMADQMVALFWDDEDGGFYQSGTHGEELVVRVKPVYDGATPSGNAMAGMAISWLARLSERVDLRAIAERLFTTFGPAVDAMPSQYTSLLMAYRVHSGDVQVTVIAGEEQSPDVRSLLRVVDTVYAPTNFVLVIAARSGRS